LREVDNGSEIYYYSNNDLFFKYKKIYNTFQIYEKIHRILYKNNLSFYEITILIRYYAKEYLKLKNVINL